MLHFVRVLDADVEELRILDEWCEELLGECDGTCCGECVWIESRSAATGTDGGTEVSLSFEFVEVCLVVSPCGASFVACCCLLVCTEWLFAACCEEVCIERKRV